MDELEVIVIVRGSQARMEPVLAAILSARCSMRQPDPAGTPAGAAGPTQWSAEELRTLWGRLSGKARKVLAGIARKPEGYHVNKLVEDLESELGGGGHAVAGALSSVGHRIKQFPGKPALYHRDYTRGVFTMPQHVADIIREEETR